MRVIAGTARSLQLKTPEGAGTRPTTDRIKETLFNILQMEIGGSVFVDLFCGSGGIGIEALSRGADKVYFVENNQEAFDCLKENILHTKFEDRSTLLKQDVFGALSMIREERADYIFMDPPYELGYAKKVIERLKDISYVAKDTVVIVEALLHEDFSFAQEFGFKICREKTYKKNKHVFLVKKAE